jgi:hypothetical protein
MSVDEISLTAFERFLTRFNQMALSIYYSDPNSRNSYFYSLQTKNYQKLCLASDENLTSQ